MATKAVLRPLICLAKPELACSRTNTQRHLSISQCSYTSVPGFLLLAFVTKEHHAPAISYHHSTPLQFAPANPGHPLQWRKFSASSAAKAAVVTANPRKDEEGNEMLIDITARAADVCLSISRDLISYDC